MIKNLICRTRHIVYQPLLIAYEEGVRPGDSEIVHHRGGLAGSYLLDYAAGAVRLANVRANPEGAGVDPTFFIGVEGVLGCSIDRLA